VKEFDDCSYCGGRVSQRFVQKACWWGENLTAIIDAVPAGVCEQCGEKFFEAKTLKEIERLLKEKEFSSTAEIPVATFPKLA
jgi:YgiT-type zinc finger domain-containing protein